MIEVSAEGAVVGGFRTNSISGTVFRKTNVVFKDIIQTGSRSDIGDRDDD